MWFFYWFFKFQYVVAYSIGFPVGTLPGADGLPDKVFTGYQQFGCYLVYVGLVLWTARAHLRHVVRRAFGRAASTRAEQSELMSYPLAFWGFVVSFALMVGDSCLVGVRVDIALVLWLSYLMLAIGLTRIAVEGGILALQHHTSPLAAIAKLFGNGGNAWLGFDNGVAPAGFFQAGMVNHMRGFIMPSFVHSFKLAHDHKIAPKPLAALIVATILISFVVSWWTVIHLGYDHGGLSMGHRWWAQDGPKMPADFISSMTRPDRSGAAVTRWVWLIFGGALTYLMMLARSRFTLFPFHPIGYLLALTYSGATFWSSIFVGWLAKTVITRFGGNDAYRKVVPAFLGLILGDVTMMLFWLVIDGWQGRVGHLLLPG